jgi:hypothetical protein
MLGWVSQFIRGGKSSGSHIPLYLIVPLHRAGATTLASVAALLSCSSAPTAADDIESSKSNILCALVRSFIQRATMVTMVTVVLWSLPRVTAQLASVEVLATGARP